MKKYALRQDLRLQKQRNKAEHCLLSEVNLIYTTFREIAVLITNYWFSLYWQWTTSLRGALLRKLQIYKYCPDVRTVSVRKATRIMWKQESTKHWSLFKCCMIIHIVLKAITFAMKDYRIFYTFLQLSELPKTCIKIRNHVSFSASIHITSKVSGTPWIKKAPY
jgi:hypothetical protein